MRQRCNLRNVDHQRGSTLLVAILVLSGLFSVAALTLVKIKRGQAASSQARFQTIALFAAESGSNAGIEFLRANVSPTTFFGAFVSPDNTTIQTPLGIAGNTVLAGDVGSLFDGSTEMSYTVSILNNKEDPGFVHGTDTDGIVILRSVGRGPDTSMIVVEVTVHNNGVGLPLDILRWRTIP